MTVSDVRSRPDLTIDFAQERATLTVQEAAALLGIGRNACYEAIHRGDLPSLKFGSRIVVPTAPLLRLLGVEGPSL